MMPKNVGIEWVNNYAGKFRFLPWSNYNTQGFLNTVNKAAAGNFEYGDALPLPAPPAGPARGKHFEPTPHPPLGAGDVDAVQARGGEDETGVETVDLVYFCGHGTVDHLFFGGANLDDSEAWNGEMRLGNQEKLKWFVADACDVLQAGHFNSQGIFVPGGSGEDVRLRWRRIFQGLRYLLGFHGESTSVANRGRSFALDLNLGQTIRHAWEMACEHSEPGFAYWAYIWYGAVNDSVQNDVWADDTLTTFKFITPQPCVYVRNIPPTLT